ncbi:MAG: hypothetical protein Q4G13_01270 [Moraxella sp.]|nr:hypothetical protein [Moraxella sp.]
MKSPFFKDGVELEPFAFETNSLDEAIARSVAIDKAYTDGATQTTQTNSDTDTPIVLTGKELGEFDTDTEAGKQAFRDKLLPILESMTGDWVHNKALGKDIEIRNRGIDEMMAWSGNPRKLKLMANIKPIIETAYAKGNPLQDNYKKDKKAQALNYFHLYKRADIDGDKFEFRVVIEEDADGLLHYDLVVPKTGEVAVDSIGELTPQYRTEDSANTLSNPNKIITDDDRQSQAYFDSVLDKIIADDDAGLDDDLDTELDGETDDDEIDNQSLSLFDDEMFDGVMFDGTGGYVLNLFIYDENGNEILDDDAMDTQSQEKNESQEQAQTQGNQNESQEQDNAPQAKTVRYENIIDEAAKLFGKYGKKGEMLTWKENGVPHYKVFSGARATRTKLLNQLYDRGGMNGNVSEIKVSDIKHLGNPKDDHETIKHSNAENLLKQLGYEIVYPEFTDDYKVGDWFTSTPADLDERSYGTQKRYYQVMSKRAKQGKMVVEVATESTISNVEAEHWYELIKTGKVQRATADEKNAYDERTKQKKHSEYYYRNKLALTVYTKDEYDNGNPIYISEIHIKYGRTEKADNMRSDKDKSNIELIKALLTYRNETNFENKLKYLNDGSGIENLLETGEVLNADPATQKAKTKADENGILLAEDFPKKPMKPRLSQIGLGKKNNDIVIVNRVAKKDVKTTVEHSSVDSEVFVNGHLAVKNPPKFIVEHMNKMRVDYDNGDAPSTTRLISTNDVERLINSVENNSNKYKVVAHKHQLTLLQDDDGDLLMINKSYYNVFAYRYGNDEFRSKNKDSNNPKWHRNGGLAVYANNELVGVVMPIRYSDEDVAMVKDMLKQEQAAKALEETAGETIIAPTNDEPTAEPTAEPNTQTGVQMSEQEVQFLTDIVNGVSDPLEADLDEMERIGLKYGDDSELFINATNAIAKAFSELDIDGL